MHPYVHSSTIHNSQGMEATSMSSNRWMDKDVVRIYNTAQPKKYPEWNNAIYMDLEISIEKAMATHSSILAWKIPWMEEPSRLQSMGLQRVRHNWATSLSLFTFTHWRRKWQPTPVFLPGESQGRRAWWAVIYGFTQSLKRLKRLSSSSSSRDCYTKWSKSDKEIETPHHLCGI